MAVPEKRVEDDPFTTLLRSGFELHQRADYVDALPLLEQAFRLRPHDYFVNLLLGIDLLRIRKPEQAINYLREAIRQRPKEDFPYEYQGEAQAMLGHYAGAAKAYLKAINVSPQSAEATEGWVNYALERFRQLAGVLRSTQAGLAAEYRLQARSYPVGNPKRQGLLEQSLALDPTAPGALSELTLVNFEAGDIVEARRNAERALAADASELRAMEAAALLAAYAGDWKRAIKLLNEIGSHSPSLLEEMRKDWPEGLLPPSSVTGTGRAAAFIRCVNGEEKASCASISGVISRVRGQIPSSAKLFREQRWDELVALREPGGGERAAWFRRGAALAQMNRCEQAIPALEYGLGDGAEGVYSRFLLSWCYADEAGKSDGRIQQSGGDPAIPHLVRGDVLLRMQGDATSAINEYQAALAVRSNDPKLLERLAEAEVAAGKLDAAAENARAALGIDAHRESAKQTLARVALEKGEYGEALPLLRELLKGNPSDVGTQVSLVTVLAEMGESAEALRLIKGILTAGYLDEQGSLHSQMGALLRKTGDPAGAAMAYAKARQLSEAYQQSAHRGPEAAQ